MKHIAKLQHSYLYKKYINLIRYYLKKLLINPRRINQFLKQVKEIKYNDQQKLYNITVDTLSLNERGRLRRAIMQNLKDIAPTSTIVLKDINVGYYDKCLEKYLHERLDLFITNEQTCWYKMAQNNKCIGFLKPDMEFDDKAKKAFLQQKEKIKPGWDQPEYINLLKRNDEGYIFFLSNYEFTKDDGIIQLVRNIQQYGFSNYLSVSSPIILGYSIISQTYSLISGRHRIASLKYLASQDIISSKQEIVCHIIKYPYDSLIYTRPYASECITCINDAVPIRKKENL